MVSAKQGNAKKRAPIAQNNGRRYKPPITRSGIVGAVYNTRAPPINPMFTASQIPDNPGYVDFNEPTPPQQPSPAKINMNPQPVKHRYPRRGVNNVNNKPMPPRNQNNANGWGPSRVPPGQMVNQPPIPPPQAGRNFRNGSMPRIGRPMTPPMGMRPPMPPPPAPPNMNPNRFGPRPMMPPPMAGCPVPPPMGPPRPPMRVGGPVPPRPIMARGNGPPAGGPMRRGRAIANNRKNNMKNRKRPPVGPPPKNKKISHHEKNFKRNSESISTG